MATTEQLQSRLNWARRQKAYAWAKFYEARTDNLRQDRIVYRTIENTTELLPAHIKTEFLEMAKTLKKKWECPVCMDFIEEDKLEITMCGHFYCKGCLEKWKQTEKDKGKEKWKCGLCNKQFKFNED